MIIFQFQDDNELPCGQTNVVQIVPQTHLDFPNGRMLRSRVDKTRLAPPPHAVITWTPSLWTELDPEDQTNIYRNKTDLFALAVGSNCKGKVLILCRNKCYGKLHIASATAFKPCLLAEGQGAGIGKEDNTIDQQFGQSNKEPLSISKWTIVKPMHQTF